MTHIQQMQEKVRKKHPVDDFHGHHIISPEDLDTLIAEVVKETEERERERIVERVRQGHFAKVADDESWNNDNVKGYKTALEDVADALTPPDKEELSTNTKEV